MPGPAPTLTYLVEDTFISSSPSVRHKDCNIRAGDIEIIRNIRDAYDRVFYQERNGMWYPDILRDNMLKKQEQEIARTLWEKYCMRFPPRLRYPLSAKSRHPIKLQHLVAPSAVKR